MTLKSKKYTTTKKFPLMAGGKMIGGKTPNMKIKKVGYYIVEFTFDSPKKDRLISERIIEKKFY